MTARLLNYVLYALGILLAGSGFILEWKIPHGPAGKSVSLWGMDKHDWKDFHLWGGILLTILVLWHLWLHRKWLTNVACKKNRNKLLVGLLFPVVLLGAIAATPLGQASSEQGGCGDCGNCSIQSSCSSKGANHCGTSKLKNSCNPNTKSGSCSTHGCPSESGPSSQPSKETSPQKKTGSGCRSGDCQSGCK